MFTLLPQCQGLETLQGASQSHVLRAGILFVHDPQTFRWGLQRMTIKLSERSCLIILFLLPFILQFPQKAFTKSLPMEAYRFEIQETINTLEAGEGTLDPEETSHLREKLPPGLTVESSEQEEVRVDRRTLQKWIRKAQESSEGRSQLITHLKALLHQLKSEGDGVFPAKSEWEEYRAGLEEVFRLKEFRHLKEQQKPPWLEFLGKLIERIRKWLGAHLGAIEKFGGSWILYAVYGIVLLLGGFILVKIIRSSGSLGWRWRQTRFSPLSGKPAPLPTMDWSKWREEAREMALQGAFREAVRALFVSALMEGHQRGWWIYEVEATNREHLARVEGSRERREALKQLIHLYERAWYGLGQPGREIFQSCETWVKRMEAAE